MKISFSKEQTFVPVFNGNRDLPSNEQIVIKHTVVEFGRLLEIVEVLQQQGFDKVDTEALDTSDPETVSKIKSVLNMTSDVLPKHVLEVKNLSTDDGPVKPEELHLYAPLIGLAFECLIEVVNASSPSEADVKN